MTPTALHNWYTEHSLPGTAVCIPRTLPCGRDSGLAGVQLTESSMFKLYFLLSKPGPSRVVYTWPEKKRRSASTFSARTADNEKHEDTAAAYWGARDTET